MPYGVPVEAELGKVGGKEDDLEAEAEESLADKIKSAARKVVKR